MPLTPATPKQKSMYFAKSDKQLTKKPRSHLPYDVHVPALYCIGQTEPEPLHVLEAPHAQAIQLLMNS